MGQISSRSESEYSDGVSDVDMEDGSMFRSGTDGISPDDGSDDYSYMSIGSSDDNTSIQVRRKHRPKSLNLSRSVSGTSSEDETSDSAISTDMDSKYGAGGGQQQPGPHELRIALAASAFVEDMRGVDINTETDEEVADISANNDKVLFSPSAPVSPSWREGLESPPFSPRRRDSYPGKRRGSSPVSPKDKRFTYNDLSPPSRQLSLEDIFDKDAHVKTADQSYAQKHSPKSPDEVTDIVYGSDGDYERPTSSLKKSKPFYSLEDAAMDLNDTTTIMDLATYAATVASNTASLTSMSISPTNLETKAKHGSPDSRNSPTSPGGYDNAPYPDDNGQEVESLDDEIELADPSQKSIDYQGSKRQKARPPTTDWSPVIDLSPILDVSPSLEEAEQAEMLAQQQQERERQASREEEEEYDPLAVNTFIAIGDATAETDYEYYGLKRYEVVQDIGERITHTSGNTNAKETHDGLNRDGTDVKSAVLKCESRLNEQTQRKSEDNNRRTLQTAHVPNRSTDAQTENKNVQNETYNSSVVISKKLKTEEQYKERPLQSDQTDVKTVDINSSNANKNKVRRKLPEPNADIIATQKPPVPKPRRKDRLPDTSQSSPAPPPKPARVSKSELKEPTRNPPIYSQSTFANKVLQQPANKPVPAQKKPQPIQKQNSEERRKTAKDMKAKPDPLIMSHLELEDASASPQYKVLESPPSPENKPVVRREYSDSTSVSPSSSPDRESFQYPSPVTPPDSDSSPPKPHSPSSGTDFEDEFILICDDSNQRSKSKEKVRNTNLSSDRRHKANHSRDNTDKGSSAPEKVGGHVLCVLFIVCCCSSFLAFDFSRFCVIIRFFSSPPQRPMISDFEGFLSQIVSIAFFVLFLFFRKSQYFPFQC